MSKIEFNFIDELPTVFNILKFNPEAIVDDTAVERLLSWLENVSSQKNPRLVEKSLQLLEAEEIWKHTLTLSFSLRFAGFLGQHYGSTSEHVETILKEMLINVRKHERFSDATVQYSFYKCLLSLSKDIFWCCFLEVFLNTTLEMFKKSYLYVKKAAVEFFASFLHTVLVNESPSLLAVHAAVEKMSDPDELEQLVESVLLLSDFDLLLSYIFTSESKLIKTLTLLLKSSEPATRCQLTKTMEALFSVLTREGLTVDWCMMTEANYEEFLLDLVKFVKQCSELQTLVPSLCNSLMTVTTKSQSFSPAWNYKLLQFSLLDISYHHHSLRNVFNNDLLHDYGNLLDVKLWKKLLIVTLNEMIKIEKKIGADECCAELLRSWRSYVLKILTVALSSDSNGQVIDEYLITVMYDKKIPRLCFQYLKVIDFSRFDDSLKNEFLSCLWYCLCCHSDSAQVICSALELLSIYITQDESNLTQLINYPHNADSSINKTADSSINKTADSSINNTADSSINNTAGSSINKTADSSINNTADPTVQSTKYTLGEIFNKLLWDTNWEVQDSLISVLMKILENAKKTSISHTFLKENIFWVKALDLLNNQESYIRSSTVTFIGSVVLVKPLWQIFCEKYEYSMLDLWKLFKTTFTCEERQDDMFTRRSILQTIKMWISSELDYVCVFLHHNATSNDCADVSEVDAVKTCLLDILENGTRDFDWEVRKLTFSTLAELARISCEKTQQNKDFFINALVDSSLAFSVCAGVSDCEYLVKIEAANCLIFIKQNYISAFTAHDQDPAATLFIQDQSTNQHHHPNKVIESLIEYESTLKGFKETMKQNDFLSFIGGVDFEKFSEHLDILDVQVNSDPVSFIQDIIASAKQSDANLLDCY